jgi:diguanylate cyclase (GGDEF)-like protein
MGPPDRNPPPSPSLAARSRYINAPLTLRGKTVLVISITILLLLLVIYGLLRLVMFRSAAFMEHQEMQTNVGRVISTIADDLDSLNRTTGDYATWDDTYAFVTNSDPEYIAQNANDTVFTINELNLFIITDVAGNVIYGKAFDRQRNQVLPLPPAFQDFHQHPLIQHGALTSQLSGVVMFEQTPLLIASRPIITSTGEGPIRGTLMMGRALDSALVERLSRSTRLPIKLYHADEPLAGVTWEALRSHAADQSPLVRAVAPETLAGYHVIKDIYGQPILALEVLTPRTMYIQTSASLTYFTVALFAAGGVVILVILQVLEQVVLSRVRRLTWRVEEIGDQSDLMGRVTVSGQDEISHLASRINRMLGALELAQNHLQRWVNELEQRNEEMLLLKAMGDLLQSIHTTAEAYTIIARYLSLLFPATHGCLGILNPDTNLVEAVVSWDAVCTVEHGTVFAAADCWALSSGEIYAVAHPQQAPLCRHVAATTTQSLCLPLVVHSETLGLLSITSAAAADQAFFLSDAKRQLAVTLAEHIKLAITNLRLRETLQEQAVRDGLTKLFNRRYMEETLEREVHQATRKSTSLGVMMVDVDFFKQVNDSFGHAAGDTLLRELGQFLQASVRVEDVVCRYGGEEFTVIMPNAPLEIVQQRAEQIRTDIPKLRIEYNGQLLGPISVSIGISAFPQHGECGEILVKGADTALYVAKHNGRNQVRVAPAAIPEI